MPNATHILMFPYPAQGHMLPMLHLAHQLSLHTAIKITVLVTPKNLPTLKPLLLSHPSIQTLVLPLPNYPSLPQGVENVRDMGNSGNLPIMNALGQLHGPIVQWFKAHPDPPVAIISDFFLGWTQHLADELNIPRIAFYSSGAFLTAVNNFLWNNLEKRSLPAVRFEDLPKKPTFAKEHLPTMCLKYIESDPEWEFVKDGMLANLSSYGCVFNTFDALEGEYMAHLRNNFRVWGVGPLTGPEDKGLHSDHEEVSGWLDGCPDGSVLYVCFGSQKTLTTAQTEALADGLEKSGARFVWVVKGPVPDGFEGRVSGRGLVIKKWAPQAKILSHRAVVGFLTHCGWNSTLEGIVAGVMMLTWPMEADQFVDARLLVEDVGSAVGVCEGAHSVPDSSELARTISETMRDAREYKLKAEKMKERALEAVGKGGSSSVDLDNLVHELVKFGTNV